MRILVAGATGNTGRYAAEELLQKDEEVTAAATNADSIIKIYGQKVKPAVLDFTDESTFDKALEDVDRVFLMRPPQLGKAEDMYPFIDAMKKRDIKLVCFLSLMGAEKNPFPPHHKIEKYIKASGIPYVYLRPSFFMQNLSGIHALEIREKDEIMIPAGKSRTSFIDAADIGLAAAVVLNEPEKYKNTAWTITGPESLDYYQAAEILSSITKRKITYTNPGILKYRDYYINKRGLEKNYVNVTAALYIMTRLGTAKKVTQDFYKLTGRKPRSLEDFARDNLKAFMP